jgi:hypothetical protein
VSCWSKALGKNFVDGDSEGMMRWILSEIREYEGVLSTREDYCA